MTRFEVIPAIDLLAGQAVRLTQGRYEEAAATFSRTVEVDLTFADAIFLENRDGKRIESTANSSRLIT